LNASEKEKQVKVRENEATNLQVKSEEICESNCKEQDSGNK
jgi:hypothetical protein